MFHSAGCIHFQELWHDVDGDTLLHLLEQLEQPERVQSAAAEKGKNKRESLTLGDKKVICDVSDELAMGGRYKLTQQEIANEASRRLGRPIGRTTVTKVLKHYDYYKNVKSLDAERQRKKRRPPGTVDAATTPEVALLLFTWTLSCLGGSE
jgi:hypothetical protein